MMLPSFAINGRMCPLWQPLALDCFLGVEHAKPRLVILPLYSEAFFHYQRRGQKQFFTFLRRIDGEKIDLNQGFRVLKQVH